MFKLIQALNSFLGTVLALAVVVLLSAGGWIAFKTYYGGKFALEAANERLAQRQAEVAGLERDLASRTAKLEQLGGELDSTRQEVARLAKDVQAKAREIQRLATALKLLKVDRRLAEITVLGQETSPADGKLVTRFRFVEVDPQGHPLAEPRVFSIEGDVVYLDSWVIKFTDENVEANDPLRSTSICLFRRIFGENQEPADGFPLDKVGSQPAAYRTGGKPSEWERQLWSRFWEYANDTELAKGQGVRAAHGEAPSIKLMPGKRYKVELRASAGLSVKPEDAPADAPAEDQASQPS